MSRSAGGTGPEVVVTGATGAVGRYVARLLGGEARLLVRDPGKAAALGLPGHVVRGDYREPESLRAAFAGAGALFAVTNDPLRPQDDENLLEAARAAGVRHVVRLSWLGVTDPGADDLVARWNRDGERRLRESGLSWTVLRLRSPMSNALAWAGGIRAEGVVRVLGADAPTACVDPADAAAVAVAALRDPDAHAGRAYGLTGPAAVSPRDQVAVLAELLGRPLRVEELTPPQALAGWRRKLPEPVAQALLEMAGRRGDGVSARVLPDVGRVLGRPAGSFREWAGRHLESFART
ncbi:NAD(P)H-binding protein [Streptomyces sp. NPDC012888]|uniref:NAD(P)H-binding protein n=1 Tax=Streptomyces sp. NPDC012888 TaxID=3364855 RepID=UPI0036907DAD